MSNVQIEIKVSTPLLHSVIDQLLDAIEHRPELADDVMHFIFDEVNEIRAGLCDVNPRHGRDTHHADGSVSFGFGVELRASEQLIQFASAISQGFVPQMPIAGGASTEGG
ncbi:hypothetical protein Q8F57_003350 [Paraburkholderia terrae]|uniref:hypothetical protein n=1 Tax=Paraburkholderia terrae TaxID=311230 RepID=UPI00296AB52E|nr:hypothetical protein [Paraburkholderia terrae]MDW3655438.1 hypothetical protein [Paraburkholderia terrae]